MSIDYTELQKSVGRYLGYGRDIPAADDSSEQWADIDECIQSGLRQFYSPPPIGDGLAHQWSFLRPTGTINLEADKADYDLPDDLGGIIGLLTYPADEAKAPIRITSEANIRRLRNRTTTFGPPSQAAVRPKATSGNAPQGYELMLWPTPKAVVEISYRYYVLPQKLTHINPYPYGGRLHGETILQSCLAAAERLMDDGRGIHWQQFMERLAASVQLDRKNGPDYFGYNGDRSGDASARRPRLSEVTYTGPVS